MRKLIILCLVILLSVSGCSTGESDDEKLVIMSWNIQNLFDDVDNGTEYREFDPGNGEWTYDSFSRKSGALADVITASVSGGPDVVLMQEVENANALRHLNEESLKACGYKYSQFFPTENSAVGIGVLSRLPISSVNSHAINCGGRMRGRNIAELHLTPEDGLNIIIFINHWKSKLGGAEATEPYRVAAAELLLELMKDARMEFPDAAVLAAGDFNESHDEFSRIGSAYPTAITSGRLKGADEYKLFNPWTDYSGTGSSGSYFYNGSWETIDQFFLDAGFFDGAGWEYGRFDTVVLDFNSTVDGLPLKWQTGSAGGSSDHFPVILELVKSD